MTLMGSAKAGDLTALRYPLFALPKLDGIRAYVRGDTLYSRNHKRIPNAFIQAWAKATRLPEGLEGEIICPDPTAPHGEVASLVRAFDTEKDFLFAPFDIGLQRDWEFKPYQHRLRYIQGLKFQRKFDIQAVFCGTASLAQKLFEGWSLEGYEGMMLRCPDGHYLRKKSTTRGQHLMKVKFFHDEEATVVAVWEEKDKTGALKGRLGAVTLRLDDGTECYCGSGFTADERDSLWNESIIGRIVTVKYQPTRVTGRAHGEVPRFPIFKGFRDDGI